MKDKEYANKICRKINPLVHENKLEGIIRKWVQGCNQEVN
jgi:hypothetical protein